MKFLEDVSPEIIKEYIGSYIVFGGIGILDGLQNIHDRSYTYRIVDADEDRIVIKAYGRQRHNILPYYNFNQPCVILTKEEYKELPSPTWRRKK